MTDEKHSLRTRLVQRSRPEKGSRRSVNPPVVRASTVLYENVETLRSVRAERAKRNRTYSYGTHGTPTTFALEDMITDLEGGYRTRVSGSGLAAIAFGLMPFVRPGDHCLITECAYEPVRKFAAAFLEPYGVTCEVYKADGSDIVSRFKPNTRLVYAEVPGSQTFEMLDLPALARETRKRGITLAVDNTWGSGILYQPLKLGADVSMIAGTKHIVGHSDVLLGAVTTTEAAWGPVHDMHDAFGICVSSDDAYLALRGVRTMAVRMPAHAESTAKVCAWAKGRPEIADVLWPALPSHPGHEIWKRDFKGACGLFSMEFKAEQAKVDRFINALQCFGIGASWGGYESLVMLTNVPPLRTVTDWSKRGPIVRFHIGLEDPDDLIRDLEQAMQYLR
ncbi:MAG TPA: cystathionine beta-lyase [Hyphomicrobiaceae bacterium]|nr:cystathionine beta-lyase [Hyphomicrobiaceae bacterium]